VGSGADTMHAVKGVGCVRFQLDLGGFLEVDEVMYVPELRVNLLYVSALEDKGYAMMFEDGQGLKWSEGASLDATMRLGIRKDMMYRVLGQPVVGFKGILDQQSVSIVESSGREASSKTVSWYDLTLMEEQNRTLD
jgi:hypothetical protein